MNLVGITNENEFYTNHYLNEIFEGNIQDTISSWQNKENESDVYKTPFKRLRGIGPSYLELLKELSKKNNTNKDKIQSSREFYKTFLDILDYSFSYTTKELDEFSVPLLLEVNKNDGSPYLWVVESFCDDSCDVLTNSIEKEQLQELDEVDTEINYDNIITSHIFTLPEPPRWLILVSPFQIVLIERAKWAQKRFLRFDIQDIISRKEDAMLKAFCVLLHKDSLAPKDGLSLLDTLDENSHKHAFGVTEDLKYSLRSAVELLGNESIYYHLQNNPNFLQTQNIESDLTREALRYMYRLLFLFYIESRPELGFIPDKSQAFLKGYSLETLRDLELMPLLTDNDKNGYFFDDSIRLLFDMIYEGRISHKVNMIGKDIFSISPLRSHLFDPKKTPLLNSIKLRNHIWQEIIQSLSLSREKKGNKGRGRISYANLGINQLGAVYEALLSYKGFIAKETLYEVKKAGTNPTPLENAYFVTESQLSEYKEEERVFDNGILRRYKTGSFIYRLAGRDREKSASYYTPEVLTKSLVKYALKELLEIDDEGKIGKSADEILKLTVCEPAMGSAAFLNEAINQLSEAYVHQKQFETGEKIAHDKYIEELQKVKMHIADNNVFGVDLNPTAVELAEISLWLNALSGSFVPWFGFQLENGNSLIGARREVYEIHQLTATKKALIWYEDAPKRLAPKSLWLAKKRETTLGQSTGSLFKDPSKLPLVIVEDEKEDSKSAGRKKDTQIYHFLVGDKGMANYTDKVVKSLKKDEIEHINKWRKEFIKPHTSTEVKALLSLSLSIDKLWQEQTRHLDDMKKKTTDTLYVWGQPKAKKQETNIEYKDTVFMQEKLSTDVKSSSPYMRLKIVMDYWCSLWFWPIEQAKLLPTRAEFLHDISLLVEKRDDIIMNFDKDLFSDTIDDEIRATQLTELGFIDVAEQIEKNQRLQVVQEVSVKQKFLHWELEFADVFAKKGGFDLILGNPPWLKLEWEESGIIGESNPLFTIRNLSANKIDRQRELTFEKYVSLENEYLGEYITQSGTLNYLNSFQNFPLLKGVQTNLYKCFLPISWKIGSSISVSGLLHPESIYDDPRGGILRERVFLKLRHHYQFQNAFSLFQDIDWHNKFSINIYSNEKKKNIDFFHMSNLFHPKTIEASYKHNNLNEDVPGIKTIESKWNTLPHYDRLVRVNLETLKNFSSYLDGDLKNIQEARLPAIHSTQLINVIKKINKFQKIKDADILQADTLLNETSSQKTRLIKRNTIFPDSLDEFIYSGPHYTNALPIFQSAKNNCKSNRDYSYIDLLTIDENYIPRTVYTPIVGNNDLETFKVKSNDYRVLGRFQIASTVNNERTFITSIIPPNVLHIHTSMSYRFDNLKNLLIASALFVSVPYDFIAKSSGASTLSSLNYSLPWLKNLSSSALCRILILNSLTSSYKRLWESSFEVDFIGESWSKQNDPRLNNDSYANLTPIWKRDVALRTDYERRQALVEIDVLVAQELKLNLVELKTIYRIQFPVMQQYEKETYYDINGRIVFTASRGLAGVGLPRKADKKTALYKIVLDGIITEEKPLGWEDIKDMQNGEIHRTIIDDTIPNGPVMRTIIYKAPFAKCDREKDYEIAWEYFERLNINGN